MKTLVTLALVVGILGLGLKGSSAQTAPVPGAAPSVPSAPVPAPVPQVVHWGWYTLVAVSQMTNGNWDIKLKNPGTGYVHSLTLVEGPPEPYRLGDTAGQGTTSDGLVYLKIEGKFHQALSPR